MIMPRRAPLPLSVSLFCIGALALLWSAGLGIYGASLPKAGADRATRTDAIIVLTGGSERLAEGIALLRAGLAAKLFVSGVPEGLSIASILTSAPAGSGSPQELACCIELGHTAEDTAGNAIEAAAWMARQGFRSARLVTGSYHMPRSMLEFHLAMPDARLIANPVFPEHVKVEQWWRFRGTANLISGEFLKYLRALVQAPFRPSPTQSTRS